MTDNPTVRCNNCEKEWTEDVDFQVFECDVCNTDEYLMDLEKEEE